jgi:Fe-S-cluster containining protein
MDISRKTKILEDLYRLYDETVAAEAVACEKGCPHCCTRNVAVTTLEGFRLVDALGAEAIETLYARLSRAAGRQRFRPRITINHLAEISMTDADPPEEACDPAWTPCELLEGDLCTEYDLRPFACRCMASSLVCSPGGFADMSDFLVTVNTVFQQVIEHLDVPGATGNLADVLAVFREVENRSLYRTGMLRPEAAGLPANRHLKMLMIPPEHRQRLAPVVARIQELMGG